LSTKVDIVLLHWLWIWHFSCLHFRLEASNPQISLKSARILCGCSVNVPSARRMGRRHFFSPFLALGIHWNAGMAQLLLHCIPISGQGHHRGETDTNDFALQSRCPFPP
jgi:hypothetical protein